MVEEIKTVNVVTAIITLVLFLAAGVFSVMGFVGAQYGLGIVSALLMVILGYFVWSDYCKYIRKE